MASAPVTGYDAVVIGSGPNGLAAACEIAHAGHSVLVVEARDTVGGGVRTAELTLPGFHHDVCAAMHPLGLASPFLRSLPLGELGVEWVHAPVPAAHPLDGQPAVLAHRSVEETAAGLGGDAGAWRRLFGPIVGRWEQIIGDLLGPLRVPDHPITYVGFGALALVPATWMAKALLRETRARALFTGMAGHSMLPLDHAATGAYALMLSMLGQAVGWPVVKGGSQGLACALQRRLEAAGGAVQTGWTVTTLDELPPARALVFDTSPKTLLRVAGERLPAGYRRQLEHFRYGPGVFKVDYALDGPVPWRDPACATAMGLHLGGTLEEIAAAEHDVAQGEHPERPYVLVGQQSLFDGTRAPEGKQTVWAYCHVPNGSTVDMRPAIEAQFERFAPGFRDRVLAFRVHNALDMERYNANYVGGDINGGVQDIFQHFTRPTRSLTPYRTPAQGIYLCSSSTPPGGGVHGMCGYHAAAAVLDDFKRGAI